MRRPLWIVTGLILSWAIAGRVGAQGQAPARDAGQSFAPPAGTAAISGTVKDEAGTPVRRATVTIEGDMRLTRSTLTDNKGRFGLSELPTGRFTVTAEKAGYPPVSYGASRPNRAGAGVFLKDGQHVTDVALTLAHGVVLTGTVYDELGAPKPGVPIMAWTVRTSLSGERTLDYGGGPLTVVTDDRGVYRTFGLPPGDYTVGTTWYYSGEPYTVHLPTPAEFQTAFPPPNQQPHPSNGSGAGVAEAPRYNYLPVFTPGVTDPLTADTYTLKAGDVRTGVDLRMQLQPTSRIEATIVNPTGARVDLRVSVTRRSSVTALNTSAVYSGATDRKFKADSLSPGPYRLSVESRPGSSEQPLWALADVLLVPGEATTLTMTLQPTVTVSGQLVFEGDALPMPDLTRVSMFLRDIAPGGARTTTKIESEGTFVTTGVVPSTYTLRTGVPGGLAPTGPGWNLKSVRVGGTNVTDRPFAVSPAGASNVIVTFTDQVSELSGTISAADGTPGTDYFVIAIPADRDYWVPGTRRITSTRPDGSGRYVFRGLPTGDYQVAVTTDLVPYDLQDVSALELLAAQSLPVTLATGERKTLDIHRPGT